MKEPGRVLMPQAVSTVKKDGLTFGVRKALLVDWNGQCGDQDRHTDQALYRSLALELMWHTIDPPR